MQVLNPLMRILHMHGVGVATVAWNRPRALNLRQAQGETERQGREQAVLSDAHRASFLMRGGLSPESSGFAGL